MNKVFTLFAIVAALVASAARADVKIPPPPQNYFNDYAGIVGTQDVVRMDAQLRTFDDQTSTQILVVIFPELPEPSVEDFTIHCVEKWRVGQKKYDNGAVLFVFLKDHKARIEVGYGLEGALPDATCNDILTEQLAPAFRQGNYAAGLQASIDSMIAATRGEYHRTQPKKASGFSNGGMPCLFIILIFIVPFFLRRAGWRTYGGGGWWLGGPWFGGWGGGGGGFSGGGGGFGGGGATGGW